MDKKDEYRTINSILSSLIGQESYRDHKRTQQGVSNVLLSYLYYKINILLIYILTSF